MSDFVLHLAVPVWTESGVEDHGVKLPTWPDLEATIGGLDGHIRTEVYLHPRRGDPETYMAVAGGSDNNYLVFLCHHNERFDEAVRPDAPEGTVSMVTGGQLGEFPLEDLVTLDEALEAARLPLERSTGRRREVAAPLSPNHAERRFRARASTPGGHVP